MISSGQYCGNKDTILSKISEAELAVFYIDGLTEIPSVISSPLRKDEHPSFRIYSPDGTRVKFFDYATGQKGSIFDLLMLMYGKSFQDTLEMISKDLTDNRKTAIYKAKLERLKVNSERGILQVRSVRSEWQEYDFSYWDSYGVPKNWLLNADIYPISHILIVSESGYVKTIKADKYAYTFIERKDGVVTEKVYQPYNKEGMKWRSGHDRSVCDLWAKLPEKGNIVIIASSRKDALCVWAQTGIPTISMQSETVLMKPQVMQELKERFKRVVVLFDNDFSAEENHGQKDSQKFAELYGIEQIEIPSKYRAKDPSDLHRYYGEGIVKQVIFEQLKQTNK